MSPRATDGTPIIDAHLLRRADQLGFWCEHCRKVHMHGLPEGHRCSHCHVTTSPLYGAGYVLRQVGEVRSWDELKRPPRPGTFDAWLRRREVTGDGIGEVVWGLQSDSQLPLDFPDRPSFFAYLRKRHFADEETLDVAAQVWALFRQRRPSSAQVPPKLRFAVLRRDGFRCRLCGASAEAGATLHVDHKHPVAKGGTSDEPNLWTLCLECNLGKGVEGLA